MIKKRKKYLLIYISATVIIFAVSVVAVKGGDNDSDYKPFSKTKDGLKFNVPEDWPIVKRGGAVAPIPTEEYLSLKFKEFDSRLDAIEKKLAKLELILQKLQETQSQVLETKKQEPEEPKK